jgi:PAS domain S-box-containing protein
MVGEGEPIQSAHTNPAASMLLRARGILPPHSPAVLRSPWFAYSLSAMLVVAATALQQLITPIFYPSTSAPFVAYYVAVMGAAWFIGLGPGLLCVALSGLAAKFFFIPTLHTLWVDVEGAEFLAICVFLSLGLFFNAVCELARRAQTEAALKAVDAARQRDLARFESAERRHALAELRESEARYHDLYDNAPDMMLSISAHTGIVIECNNTLIRELGYSREQVFGRSVYQLYDPSVVPAAQDSFAEFLTKGEVHNVELKLRRRDGTTIDVSHSSTAVFDADGRIVGSRSVWRDITDRKRAEDNARAARAELMRHQTQERDRIEAELERTQEQLVRQARLAAIGQVSASIAHDLRNPLGVIQNAAYLLKSSLDAGAPVEREVVDMIEEEVRTSDRIINNLMEMTRAREPKKERVELEPLVREVFERASPSPAIVLDCRLEPELFALWADAGQMRQVFGNLIRNSVEAIDSDSGNITVEARSGPSFDEIELRDSGPGIAADIRERLFEPLVTTKAKGTGLGLLICRQIVTRHGGSIELGDSAAGGTTFRIRLPRQPLRSNGDRELNAAHEHSLEGVNR